MSFGQYRCQGMGGHLQNIAESKEAHLSLLSGTSMCPHVVCGFDNR
jgi:hypothetical protein